MARSFEKNVTFNAVVEVNAAGPIDNRTVVNSKADLILDETFGKFKYTGMPVVTKDNGKLYILKDAANSNLEASWIEMASDSSAAAAASEVKIQDGENNLYLSVAETKAEDGHSIYTLNAKIVAFKDASETNNGLLSAWDVKQVIEEVEKVTAEGLTDLDSRATAIAERVKTIEDGSLDVSIASSTPEGVYKRYTFTQRGREIGVIDLAKDLVIKSGSVITAYKDAAGNITETPPTGEYTEIKAIKFIIANKEQTPIYIDVNDLVDVYTASGDANVTAVIENKEVKVSVAAGSTLATLISDKESDLIAYKSDVKAVDDKVVALTGDVEEIDLATSAALNDLNDRVTKIEAGEVCVKKFIKVVESGYDITISADEHKCGEYPIVQVYFDNVLVNGEVSVDASKHSDVTVDWNDALAPSKEHPVVIRILG